MPNDATDHTIAPTAALPRISAFGMLSAFMFMVLSFLGRFIFPFGDEPDFTARSYSVLYDENPWWSPYSIFHDFLADWSRENVCDIVSSPLSAWGHIQAGCREPLEQILARFGFSLMLALPLLLPIVFRRSAVKLLDPRRRFSEGEWALRLDALALAMLLPSVVAALGVFAEEQFVVILSLLLILVVRNIFLTLVLLFFVFGLDVGNGLVVFTAVVLLTFNRFLSRRFGFRTLSIVVVLELIFVLVIGFIFIDVLSSIGFLADKVGGMISVLTENDDQVNKYPVILRPAITFMSGIYMSAASLKALPLYAVFGTGIVLWSRRFRRLAAEPALELSAYGFRQRAGTPAFDECRLMLITAINVVLFFVFLLPTYSNAKYYLFLMPFFLVNALQVFDRGAMRILFVASSLTVFVFLILYNVF